MPKGPNYDRIENDFVYHKPKEGQGEKYDVIRSTAKQFAHLIDSLCPESREKSRAFSAMEDVCYHANASIARHE